MPVHNRIKTVREQQNETRKGLARKAGVARTTIIYLEDDPSSGVSTTTLAKIATALGVQVKGLLVEVSGVTAKHGDVWRNPGGEMELWCGRWQDVLAHVTECDAVITDPPYSAKTHAGHNDVANMADQGGAWPRKGGSKDKRRQRRSINYTSFDADDISEFSERWATLDCPWFVAMSDSTLINNWRSKLSAIGRTTFQPLPCVVPGMTVRLGGDGPSSWAVYATVARTKAAHKWGTLPGAYIGGQGEREHIGGKPLWLMRAIIKDYSRPGDLIVDPCAGGGTTLLAAAIEGRRAIGAELDPETFDKAVKRLSRGCTPSFLPLLEGDSLC